MTQLQEMQRLRSQPPSRRLQPNASTPPVPQKHSINGADPDCTQCAGLGIYGYNVPVGDPRFGKVYSCECTAAYRAARLQSISGLTDEERSVMLGDVIESGPGTVDMLLAARAFVEHPAGILTLWGGSGNAKSLVLQAVVNECIKRGRAAVYVTMLDLIEYIREAYNAPDDDRRGSAWQRMERYATIPILCIDEVDKVKPSEWTIERETAIFDKRYRLGLARQAGTLLAMNSNPDRLPDWIYSRLSDGRNKIIRNTDPDMRSLMR